MFLEELRWLQASQPLLTERSGETRTAAGSQGCETDIFVELPSTGAPVPMCACLYVCCAGQGLQGPALGAGCQDTGDWLRLALFTH